jgi:hypothetical protein
MTEEQRNEVLKEELRKILLKMHKGDKSLAETRDDLFETVKGMEFALKRHFIYLLEGIYQEPLKVKAMSPEDQGFVKGWNESSDENNFAIKLAISVIKGEKKS